MYGSEAQDVNCQFERIQRVLFYFVTIVFVKMFDFRFLTALYALRGPKCILTFSGMISVCACLSVCVFNKDLA